MTNPLIPNLQMARTFLNTLDEEAKQFTFQTIDDNKQRHSSALARTIHGSLDDCATQLTKAQASGAGVFVTINECDGLGRAMKNVVRVRAHFIDLDGAPLDPVTDSAVPPHIIVESSANKWHCYWLIENCDFDDFKPRQHALATQFDGDPSVCDLPRVMRLPGFWHQKGTPFQTRLIQPNFTA